MFLKTKKIGLGFLTAIAVFVMVFGALFFEPQSAKAIPFELTAPVPVPTMMVLNPDEDKRTLLEKIKTEGLLMVMSSIMNGLNYFTNKIAYDMGVWLASGNFGQGPFASGESFGNYLAQVAGDSLGEALGSLSQDLGLNLCDLPDLRLDLALQLGFHFAYGPPKPKCSWQQLKAAYNVENIRSKYASREGLASRVGLGVQVNDTDFGIALKAKERVDAYTAEQSTGKSLDRQEGQGISALTDIISGRQKIPATVMKEEFTAQGAAAQKEGRAADTRAMMAAALEKGGVALAMNTVSTFVNTMLGTVLNNFLTKGMLPGGTKVCNPGLTITGVNLQPCEEDSEGSTAESYYGAGSAGGAGQRRAAQEMFSELLLPQIRTIENYNPLPNLAECSPDNTSADACVVDQSFMQLLQQADTGEALTVSQAIEKGWLHGDWQLVSPGNLEETDKFTCAQEAYCYRNLQFLRQLDILPVGFELAAYWSPPSTPDTLKQVVDGFYSCNAQGGRDAAYPYCHLINPHWVIKLPKLRCQSFVYGAIARGGTRLQECADLQHCVGFNKDGSCQTWGYCLKERPVWKFNANYCDSQLNTCRAFTSSDGGSGSYLVRTLDTTSCTADNDGCRRYSLVKFWSTATSTDWYGPTAAYNPAEKVFVNTSIHLNKKAATCDTADDGCNAFKLASDPATFVYLKKAPDYLGCYDADSNTGLNSVDLLNKKLANGIQWPETFSDLNLINPQNKDACKNYAQVCLPEEENCNLYTSVLTKDTIPGKFTPAAIAEGQVTWNDQCDAKCAGYAAYREMPGNYSNGQNLAYIIPSSGKTCASADAGCTSFTNLSVTAGGLEQNEYFSYLRPCILPDQNKQKNYTVYESSEKGGYQIKTYTLEKNSADGPKQIFRDGDEMVKYTQISGNNAYCGADSYSNKTADPDCHQFIDDQGHTYYALLAKTVIVSDKCTPYRLNNNELIAYQTQLRCPFDFDPAATDKKAGAEVVEFKSNACYYMGFTDSTNGAGDSKSCTKAVDSCRVYKGNAGNNLRTLVNDNFENASTSGWIVPSGIKLSVSTESTQINGHSLKVAANSPSGGTLAAAKQKIPVQQGKGYMLSFWLKGNLPLLRVAMVNLSYDLSIAPTAINPTDVWRYYSFGPVEYNNTPTTTAILFILGDSGGSEKQFFLDNIKLTEVDDYLYLVKNSLSVDPICDSNPTDNLPGEALGCSAYATPAKTTFYLTNFSYLCREAAVGCTALLDTYNTPDDPAPRAYNVWLTGVSGKITTAAIGGDNFSCQVPNGATGCYTNIFGKTIDQLDAVSKVVLTSSTIYIPPDTSSSSPIYLVASKDATCKSENMGCQVVGLSTPSVSGKSYVFGGNLWTNPETFTEVAIKNDPALYDAALCMSEAVGCKSWVSGQSTYYFKDPVLNGNKICQYHSEPVDAVIGFSGLLPVSDKRTGWFWKDTGLCLFNNANMGRGCATDADCVMGGIAGKCQLKNQLPCYPGYRDAAGVYGLWSFGTAAEYNGFVGECPEEQSGCTEYVDRSGEFSKKCDLSGTKCETDSDCNDIDGDTCQKTPTANSAYYLLDNDKLTAAQNVCNGQVSQAEGCILLDKTTMPNKYWDTSATYDASVKNSDKLVAPVEGGTKNDANIIVKVQHDRQCAEWSYCDFQQTMIDQETGEATSKCYHLGTCQKANLAIGTQRQCAATAERTDKNQILSTAYYVSRPVFWNSLDYSGYSVPFRYQVPDLSVRTIKQGLINSTNRLVHVEKKPATLPWAYVFPCTMDGANDGKPCGFTSAACFVGGDQNSDGCLTPGGICAGDECLMSPRGSADFSNTAPSLSCRGYPAGDSPFPDSVKDTQNGSLIIGAPQFKAGFEGVNLCYHDLFTGCDCSYNKLKTSAGDVYSSEAPSAACVGGSLQGKLCDVNNVDSEERFSDCCLSGNCGADTNPGTCSPVKTLEVMNGWQGYCMENDLRQRVNGTSAHRCLTWYPLELPPGTSNVFANDSQAGYEAGKNENRYVCLNNEPALSNENAGNFYFWSQNKGTYQTFDTENSDADEFGDPEGNGVQITGKGGLEIWNANGDGTAEVKNIPSNALIAGCYLIRKDLGGCEDTGCPSYEYVLKSNNDSARRWCPLTRSTIINDNHSMKNGTGDDITGLVSANITPNNYIPDQYIERIDVVLESATNIANGKNTTGYISFIHNFNKEDPSLLPADKNKEWIIKNGTEAAPFFDLSGDTQSVSHGTSCSGNWEYWEWKTKSKASSAGSVKDSYWEMPCNNVGTKKAKASSDDEIGSIGFRLYRDNSGNLRGISALHENSKGSTQGFIFIIYFTDGHCQYLAQVAESSDDVGSFKPFAANLHTGNLKTAFDIAGGAFSASYYNDSTDCWTKNHCMVVLKRSGAIEGKLLDKAEYGKIDSTSVASTKFFINPFIPHDKNNNVPPTQCATGGYACVTASGPGGFEGGVPLMVANNWVDLRASTYDTANPYPAVIYNPKHSYYQDSFLTFCSDFPYCQMLTSMFAKVYNIYKWDGSKYAKQGSSPNYWSFDAANSKDEADVNNKVAILPPRVAAPTVNGGFELDKIAVNNQTYGTLFLPSGSTALLQFYAWASPNQMPLRQIAIKKGDGLEAILVEGESFANHKWKCGLSSYCGYGSPLAVEHYDIPCQTSADCVSLGTNQANGTYYNPNCYKYDISSGYLAFGSTADTGCREGPQEFFIDYSCDSGTQSGYKKTWGDAALTTKEWTYIEQTYGKKDFVCKFTPAVFVTDNWGWCTGNCTVTQNYYYQNLGHGCYSFAGSDGKRNQCNPGETNQWVPYASYIVVVPMKKI